MDDERRVTSLGQQIAGIPVDPRLGRMLLAASHQRCLTEMLVVASFLEAQDPRERPSDAQQAASEKHALFADPRSDFITVLNIWRRLQRAVGGTVAEPVAEVVPGALPVVRAYARVAGFALAVVSEPGGVEAAAEPGGGELHGSAPGDSDGLPRARSASSMRSVNTTGRGECGSSIAPGTPLASKPPKWVVAGSIVETTRLYARMVAAVDPGWIEAAGAHLLKRTYSEPHWEAARGYVSAYESVSLYGLTLASRRRINYGAIAPAEARDMFIREALVETPVDERALVDDYVVAGGGGGVRTPPAGREEPGTACGEALTAADLNAAMAERAEANSARRGQSAAAGRVRVVGRARQAAGKPRVVGRARVVASPGSWAERGSQRRGRGAIGDEHVTRGTRRFEFASPRACERPG